jgi:hypothetical protein
MVNVELLEKTLDHITKNPDEWNQAHWRCETGMCFAGHAAMLAGAKWLHPQFDPDDAASAVVVAPNGERYLAGTYATAALGLGPQQCLHLFNSDNTLADLRDEVHAIIRSESEKGALCHV